MLRFGKKSKLSPHYIGPFDVLKEIGNSNITLSSVVTKEKQNREIDIVVEIMISDTIELQKLMKRLKRIDSVYDIKRIH